MFSARPKKRALRLYFATDIHGSDRCFRKFLAAAQHYDADALILGGDIAGKGLVPIRSTNGALSAKVRGEAVTVPRSDEARLRAEINRIGFYSVVGDDAEIDRLQDDSSYQHAAFERAIVEQIEGWCLLAQERLAPRVRCIITPGNDDPKAIDPVLKSAPRIESPEGELCEVGPVLLASCGDVTPTPWDTDREFPEEELKHRLEKILDPAPVGSKVVVNFHNPPYGSGLDFAPELDASLLPVIRGGRPSIIPVGSRAVREVIKRYHPVVGLHGHIHESKGAQKIGASLCLNPGSDYSADVLRGAIVDFAEDGSYLDFLFTTAERPREDLIEESRRLVELTARQGITARLLGGVAVVLQSPPSGPLLLRTINDIDLVTKRGARTAVTSVIAGAGYTPDEMFNVLHGASRLLFYDEANRRKLDVFVGEFSMCHEIPIANRLEREPLTIPKAELLMTKLQVVELTERDQRDIYNLVYHHEVTVNGGTGIEGDYVAELCARDWGLWRTSKATIERCQANLTSYELDPATGSTITRRLNVLWQCIEARPKSAGWKLRNRVGDRVRWYNEPEEHAQSN